VNRVRTRHAELSLEEIADGLPGTGEVMASVGRCYANCWHAARGGNWQLAAYFFRRTRSLLRGLGVRRPKYTTQLAEFEASSLAPLLRTIDARDWEAFDAAFRAGIDEANRYHVVTNHPYIRWRLPDDVPRDLDLGPG
jgi:hypothetical protein